MDHKEIRKIQKLVKKQCAAYSLGLNSNVENTYPVLSEKYQAFNIGRAEKLRKIERKKA